MSNLEPEIDPVLSRVIAAQFYVAKNLPRDPAVAVRFITDNRNYFPSINDETLEKIKKENKLTEQDISKQKSVVFADINLERDLEEKKKKETEKYMKNRPVDSANRDYGRSSNIATDYPMHNEPNFYKTNYEKSLEEKKSEIFKESLIPELEQLKEESKKHSKEPVNEVTKFPEMEKMFAHFNVNLKEEEFTGSVKLS